MKMRRGTVERLGSKTIGYQRQRVPHRYCVVCRVGLSGRQSHYCSVGCQKTADWRREHHYPLSDTNYNWAREQDGLTPEEHKRKFEETKKQSLNGTFNKLNKLAKRLENAVVKEHKKEL